VIEDHIVIVERNDAWHLLVEGAEGGIFRQHRAINVDQHLLFFSATRGRTHAIRCGHLWTKSGNLAATRRMLSMSHTVSSAHH